MKKMIIALFAGILFAGVASAEVTAVTETFTNAMGQVQTVVVGYTSDTLSSYVPEPGLIKVLDADTLGANYDLTGLTPSALCEKVYSVSNVVAGSVTGKVAMACGLTTNDWAIIDD